MAVRPKYINPPVSYNFSVAFGSVNSTPLEDTYFSEISGISAELDVEEKKEGGLNDWVYHLPKGSKGSRITLKRGLASMNSELIKWCFDTIHFDKTQVTTKQMIISLLDKDPKQPRMTWAFYNVLPVKWSMADFNAKESNVAIESIELVFSNMEILK
jgi:phage tail-like protein